MCQCDNFTQKYHIIKYIISKSFLINKKYTYFYSIIFTHLYNLKYLYYCNIYIYYNK